MNGLMTEREWRRQAVRPRRAHPVCWGAQCVMAGKRGALKQDKAFRAFLLLTACMLAVALPMLAPKRKRSEYPMAAVQASAQQAQPREVSCVSYAMPDGVALRSVTYTREQLLRGKLLVVDAAHELPRDAPAPNTMSIAAYGRGMVPVNDLKIQSGRDTIQALIRLFDALRARDVGGLSVWRGTQSAAEWRIEQISRIRARAETATLQEAVERTLRESEDPCLAEGLQEYTVEIRLSTGDAAEPDSRALEATPQGRALLQLAWRCGFIQRRPGAKGALAYRFRYVGQAHATAMTYLNLGLEEYAQWLHQKGTLTVYENGAPKYVILCKPMTGTHIELWLPEGASWDVSLDNLGYAVAACTLNGQ
ncbi:MAG: hypothetical protein MR842_03155 [Clostridiales bacterium]|nr:hypothetical protein [Clostridiales bacterium]MDO4350073.1 hypothetical protein [Eubacteriales bacterium]MDY4009446.1 hypothetical protein [Candidatus Limiplasma sp.]